MSGSDFLWREGSAKDVGPGRSSRRRVCALVFREEKTAYVGCSRSDTGMRGGADQSEGGGPQGFGRGRRGRGGWQQKGWKPGPQTRQGWVDLRRGTGMPDPSTARGRFWAAERSEKQSTPIEYRRLRQRDFAGECASQ